MSIVGYASIFLGYMSNIFFDFRKKKIWDDVVMFVKACGYEDRDEEMCKARIHTLTSA